MITFASKDDGIAILRDEYHVKDVINHGKENVVDRVRVLTGGKVKKQNKLFNKMFD